MTLSGVVVRGQVHRQRLRDAFYRRQNIIFQAVTTLATAVMRAENQESVIKQIRGLARVMFPDGGDEELEARTREVENVLRQESSKSYKVTKVDLGERRR